MSSIWLENANTKSYPALNSSLMVDVCILGGGLTGLSCAYYLCKHNLKTCILEKDSVMQKTSGHTTQPNCISKIKKEVELLLLLFL